LLSGIHREALHGGEMDPGQQGLPTKKLTLLGAILTSGMTDERTLT
jgi:hypothetical protein